MPGKANLFNLGSIGVDLTKSPLHKDDGSLVSSQNAVPDIRDEAGALTKRDGLVAINSTALAGGTCKGVIFAPLTDQSSGGGVRRVYVALDTNTADGYGWSFSTDAFATFTDEIITNPSPPQFDSLSATQVQFPKVVVVANKLYYPAGLYTEYTDPPSIRVFDGVTDREFVRLPPNPDVPTRAVPRSIISMLAVGTTIYLSVHDDGSTSADFKGTVLSLDTKTGVLTRLGATFATGKLPGALAWSLGRLWVGTHTLAEESTTSLIYFIRPTIDTAWTADETMASATSSRVIAMVDYKGSLYAAVDRGLVTVTSTVYVRSPTDGAWTASETDADSMYRSLVVFKDNIYATRHGSIGANTTEVRKFDGTSWSSVLTSATSAFEVSLFQDGTRLYAFLYQGTTVRSSTDGTTWAAANSFTASPRLGGESFGMISI